MARNIGLDGGIDVADQIRVEAARLFYHRGYGTTTIRDIAEAVGISSSTMYHHYRNKQEVLFAITNQFMAVFNAAIVPVLRNPRLPAAERLESAVRLHLSISSERHTELLTSHSNRSVLSEEQLDEIVRMQLQYQSAMHDVIAELQGGDVPAAEVDLTTMALMDLVNGVCKWFDPAGPMAIEEIADRYVPIARAIVDARVS